MAPLFLPSWQGLPGCPLSERPALARAVVAKSVFNPPTTRLLIDMLFADKTLRSLCGWQRAGEVPGAVAEIVEGRARRREVGEGGGGSLGGKCGGGMGCLGEGGGAARAAG